MINPEDLKIDIYRRPSEVEQCPECDYGLRITHIPTGIIVEGEHPRSSILKSKLLKELERRVQQRSYLSR